MPGVNDAIASFERNIEAKTGKSVVEWASLVSKQSLAKHGQMVAWLKTEQGLSHSHANHIAKHALGAAAPRSSGDPVGYLFEDGKEGLRPLYDRLIAAVRKFGTDVEVAPKKANISLRRRRQFALIQPSTRNRLDLGLILKGKKAAGRLEPAGSFNAMFTHRVKLAVEPDVDAEVLSWLKEAYDEAI
jgi:hypothetical protein